MPSLRVREDVGSPAPPLDLPSAAGERRSLQEFRGRPVMLSFLGPANCQFCRAHVIKVIQARDDIAELGAEVLFVSHHDPELMMSKMFRDLDLPYALLVDRSGDAYARWGLGEASLKVLLVPSLYPAVFKRMLARQKSLGPAPEQRQLGGDFVVDRDGRLAFVNRMRSIHDRAPVPALLSALGRSAG